MGKPFELSVAYDSIEHDSPRRSANFPRDRYITLTTSIVNDSALRSSLRSGYHSGLLREVTRPSAEYHKTPEQPPAFPSTSVATVSCRSPILASSRAHQTSGLLPGGDPQMADLLSYLASTQSRRATDRGEPSTAMDHRANVRDPRFRRYSFPLPLSPFLSLRRDESTVHTRPHDIFLRQCLTDGGGSTECHRSTIVGRSRAIPDLATL